VGGNIILPGLIDTHVHSTLMDWRVCRSSRLASPALRRRRETGRRRRQADLAARSSVLACSFVVCLMEWSRVSRADR
jgi:imidazolonepropionase-like amidohydrolase